MGHVRGAMNKHQSEKAADTQNTAAAAVVSPATEPPALRPGSAVTQAMAISPVVVPAAAAPPSPVAMADYSPLLVAYYDRGGSIAEEYRSLRTNLLAQYADQRFCFLVTSAEAGEGKTVTSLNLAITMAERQDRQTIVVDCDMRKGRMSHLLKLPKTPGLAEVLRGTARLDEAIRQTAVPNLRVITAGSADAHEIGELVTRAELDELVSQLRRRFDYVLFDTPPMNIVAETGMIGRIVGESLLVVQMNKTRHESVEKTIRLLHAANINVIGLVLTHRTYQIPNYLYRYS